LKHPFTTPKASRRCSIRNSSVAHRDLKTAFFTSWSIQKPRRSVLTVCFLLISGTLFGQTISYGRNTDARKTDSVSPVGIFAAFGGGNTQSRSFVDNTLGYSVGAFYQPSLIGFEVRGDSYPISATFSRSPLTMGLRVAPPLPRTRIAPYAYFGVGASHGQVATANHTATAADWSACIETNLGVDVSFGRFSWRAADVTLTNTNTSSQWLRSITATTGIVYRR